MTLRFDFEVWNWVVDFWFYLRAVLDWLSIFFIFIRTCVDETKICQGLPLCSNHNDIKYCNATLWNQTSTTKWKPLAVNLYQRLSFSYQLIPKYDEIFLGNSPNYLIHTCFCQCCIQNLGFKSLPRKSNFICSFSFLAALMIVCWAGMKIEASRDHYWS